MDGNIVGYNHEFGLQLGDGDAMVLGDSLGSHLNAPDRALFERSWRRPRAKTEREPALSAFSMPVSDRCARST
jgi:hypothetical protein